MDATANNPMESGLYRTIPLAAVILGFATVGMLWTEMPDTVPIHFNTAGEANRYGSKWLLWFGPTLNLGLFYLIGKSADPSWAKYNSSFVKITEHNAEQQRTINLQMAAQVRIVICLLLAYGAYSSAQSAAGIGNGMNMPIFWSLFAGLFVVIGVHLYRMNQAK